MRPTHRIYLKTGLAQRPEQVESITAQFFDINIKAHVDVDKSRWYRVTGAGGHWTYQRFAEIDDEGVHHMLGIRMLLRRNRWYANAQDVDLSMAYPNEQDPPLIPWRPLMFLAVAGIFALILAATDQHIFGVVFTWKHYLAWALTVLIWMSGKEMWDHRG